MHFTFNGKPSQVLKFITLNLKKNLYLYETFSQGKLNK